MADLLRTSGWTKKVSTHGVVFYVKKGTGETRWEHPGLSAFLSTLSQFDNIRYAAYRLSSKLLSLCDVLSTPSLPLALVVSVLTHHGLAGPSLVLDSSELRDVIHDLYFGANRARGYLSHSSNQVYTEALSSLVELILDPQRTGGVTVLGMKTVLAILANARLRDKLAFLFREHCDHQARLDQTGLTYLLSILSRVPEVLGEGVMFGSTMVGRGVSSCLMSAGGAVVTEELWMAWAGREPTELVWLTTAYRQQSARGIRHGLKCSACQASDIEGLRYQCLQCLSYDLCQHCFFSGQFSRGHKPSHPVQEYCYRSTRKEEARAFLTTIVNKFKSRSSSAKTRTTRRRIRADRGRASLGEDDEGRKSENRASPASSGFCSGSESEAGSSPLYSALERKNSTATEYSPLVESPIMEMEGESPVMEWDDAGLELGHSRLGEDEVLGDGIAADDMWLENSVLRKDQDTGQVHMYRPQDNQETVTSHHPPLVRERLIRSKSEIGPKPEKLNVVMRKNSERVVSHRNQMVSILGHLENDHAALVDRLSGSPDMAQPVIKAQAQLNKLKDLMHSLFGGEAGLLEMSALEEEQDNEVLDSPVKKSSGVVDQPGSNGENPNAVMVEALTPLRGRQPFVRGSTGRTVINQAPCRMAENYIARPTESTRLDARYGEDARPAESTRLDAKHRDVRPAESTRLDGISTPAQNGISTPAQRSIRNNAINFFSPIVFQTEIKEEQEKERNSNGEDQMKCLEYGEQMGNPAHSSGSPDSASRMTPDSHSSFSTDCGSASLTPYNLTDLTTRLGGTMMDISHQTELDVSAQLGRCGDDGEDNSDNRVADTMDELEKLMMKLSHVFTTFREPKTPNWTNEEHGAVVRLLGEVGDNISISSAALAAAKESVIC